MDQRITTLAHNLVTYSCQVKKGDKVYVQYTGESTRSLAKELVKEIYQAGGVPFIHYTDPQLQRLQIMECTQEQMELMAQVDALEMSHMDCYIAVRGSDNVSELSDVPADKMALYEKYYVTPVHHKIRVPKTRWVVLRYPNDAMAQLSATSTEAFEDFYFRVCNLDYSKMEKAMEPLVKLMEKTERGQI